LQAPCAKPRGGGKYITHVADDEEYLQKLNEKLIEEVNEFREMK
jgi:predicted house-cleaning noncanonical NTP pyrophosphatase (MazG superfamily)